MQQLPIAAHLKGELELIRKMLATAEIAMVAPANPDAAIEAVNRGRLAARAVQKLLINVEVSPEDRAFIEQHLDKMEAHFARVLPRASA